METITIHAFDLIEAEKTASYIEYRDKVRLTYVETDGFIPYANFVFRVTWDGLTTKENN